MERLLIISLLYFCVFTNAYAGDWADKQNVKNIERGIYWKERGYEFNPNVLTAWSMDQKVKDIERGNRINKSEHRSSLYGVGTVDNGLPFPKNTSHTVEYDESFSLQVDEILSVLKMYNNGEVSEYKVVDAYNKLLERYPEIALEESTSIPNDTFRNSYPKNSPMRQTKIYSNTYLSGNDNNTLSEHGGGSFKQNIYSPTIGERTGKGTYLGQMSVNKYAPNSTSNPFGAGSQFNAYSINNKFGKYGSKFSPYSAKNPYATSPPKLYDNQGNYRGKLSTNRYDPDSVSNPYGRYGNPYSSDSINNKYGAGNPYSPDSPYNQYGTGISVYGDD